MGLQHYAWDYENLEPCDSGDWYRVADVDVLLAKYRECIRYWSYCTRQGMLWYCPEKRDELNESLRELCPGTDKG